jgi:alpha-ketoglutarate-dependent taurine dioxygenase
MWSPTDRCDLISLYGKDVGQPATPTMFVSAVDGWNSLPAELKAKVEGRSAVQHYDVDTYRKRADGDADVLISTYQTGEDFVTTPIGYIHPRTGQTILYVCQQTTQRIEGVTLAESDAILDALFDHLYAPTKEFAHRWQQGDLVFWDNLAVQHARPNVAIEGPPRTLRKTMAPMPEGKIESPRYASVAAG